MLAIIIPYYKLTFFKETLDSLAGQTNQNFKVYIGDDASPEDPFYMVKKYRGQFNFVYHRFEENLGGIALTLQWERCIALSNDEEWIMILGDDDVLGENVVAHFYANLPEIKQEEINVVRFATQVIDGEDKAISEKFEHPKLEKATDSFWRKFTGKTRSSLSEYIFSRVSYMKFGFKNYPLAWHSDDMALLEFAGRKLIYTINSAEFYIRISESSISGKGENRCQKKIASQLFYYSIIDKYISSFSKKQRIKLIARVERDYFDNKSFFLFFKIFKWHILKIDLFNLIKFIRRIYINY